MPGISGPPASSTSASLIDRARAAQPEAWERLYRLYGPLIYGWARRSGMQPQDASDVMQDVFHSLASKLQQFQIRQAGDSFRGWLWTVTRNQIRDHFRAVRKSEEQAAGGTQARQQIEQLPDRWMERDAQSASVEVSRLRSRAMELVRGDFDNRVWQAFWRTAVEGDAPADVAADLKISVWAVYKARSRVLHRLRAEFDGLID